MLQDASHLSLRDMTSTRVAQLVEIALANRDEAWELEFLRELPKSRIRVLEQAPVSGPDGWPYLMVSTDGDVDDSVASVAQWLASRGVGFVVNPEKSLPDFVLSYGMVWNFRERGQFLTATTNARSEKLEIRDGQQLYTGAPSNAFLPTDVRAVLKDFFKRQRVFGPRLLMVSTDQVQWDLAFSIESLGSPPEKEHLGIAEALSWFLPAHYSLALISEINVPGFAEL